MYIISITINDNLTETQHQELLAKHGTWFKQHFEAGNFILLGPFLDTQASAGVIIADVKNREALDKILAEDVYYPHLAQYDIREFDAKMVANFLAK